MGVLSPCQTRSTQNGFGLLLLLSHVESKCYLKITQETVLAP